MKQGHSGLSGQLNKSIEIKANFEIALVMYEDYLIEHPGIRKNMMFGSFDKHRVFKYNLYAF